MFNLKHVTRRLTVAAMLTLVVCSVANAEDKLKPFVLASISSGDVSAKAAEVKNALSAAGFTVLGDYAPNAATKVIIVTNDALKTAAGKSVRGAYGAVQRVSVAKVGDQLQVAYANPVYFQHAYRMAADLSGAADQLGQLLGNQQTFGAKGLTVKKLRNYRYKPTMEKFTNPYELASYGSHSEAVQAVETGLAEQRAGVSKIYRLDLPGEQTLFGVAMTGKNVGDKYSDDGFQMGVVDFKEHSQAAYLPYEILVNGNQIEALHMRFRMAVNFPDLRMMGKHSFMKLMKSPGAIQRALMKVAGGKDEVAIE